MICDDGCVIVEVECVIGESGVGLVSMECVIVEGVVCDWSG